MNEYVEAIRKAKRVYVCGNGGSASTANHFVNDLVKICGIRAYSLCANEALLTAYANDDSFENVFVDQLKVYAEPGDLVITISTSGKSKNLLKVHQWAEEAGIKVMAFSIYGLPSQVSPQISENQHLSLAHYICEELGW
jgi:D-sedoheptulose 7-phosphate isomerase